MSLTWARTLGWPTQMSGQRPQEWVRLAFCPDGRRRTVARIHDRFVAERKENPTNRVEERRVVASGQVGTTDGPCEKRVADEEVHPLSCRARGSCLRGRRFLIHGKADAAGTVARRVVGPSVEIAKADDFAR